MFIARSVSPWSAALLGLMACAAEAASFLAFTPDPARAGAISPEGCFTEPGLARGLLTGSSAGSTCHNGQLGSVKQGQAVAGQAPTETVAVFSTGALRDPLAVGGLATLVVYHLAESGPGIVGTGHNISARLEYELREQHPDGHATTIVAGSAFTMPPGGGRGQVSFDVPSYTVSPGGRFQVLLLSPTAPGTRVFYGGKPLIDDQSAGHAMYYGSYSDAGITLGGGSDSSGGDLAIGVVTPALLSVLLLLGALRSRSTRSE